MRWRPSWIRRNHWTPRTVDENTWRINSRFFHPTRFLTPQKLRFGTWKLGPPGIFGDSELGSNHHFKGPFVRFRGWEMSFVFVFVGILLGGDLVTKSSAVKCCASFLRPPNLYVKSNIMLLLVKTRICLLFSPIFSRKHGFTLLWFQNFTGLQGNYSFGLCHWCKSHCSSQTPVGPAAMGVLGSEVFLVWLEVRKSFRPKDLPFETIELHTFGWMLCSWWFHFPACRLFFEFSSTWEDDHLTLFY